MLANSTSATPEAARFRRRLMAWYREDGRHGLPWRLTRDPYAVLVSEVMLQQTQVERVLPYYTAWLERWPTFAALAAASPAEVIREWRGLGYNRRALNLHRLALTVTRDHGGELPASPAALRGLPGIGPYTTAAIGSFAREQRIAVADTNIARVLARAFFGAPTRREVPARALADRADALLPSRDVRHHNLALMDLGALVCGSRAPRCAECPVTRHCAWKAAGYPPGEATRTPTPRFELTARFARGRIIDALRTAPATAAELAAMLPAHHAARIGHYLEALEKDALIAPASDGLWALPLEPR
ncbi:MAG: A/G-specific adenine glycosylase [Dehalococcoidia bacterium]|nr:A/G-specific adenine glycosylase [Dehalococcoidia bacterium]